ncbi:2-dehydro-3-deoxygalactonokinase [Pseudovibrio exalbescens]|uniref:2-dehydro-3-deoxygalactonokinase n=1 Tax=Pseudovibrio exalbescens TaxID=197461 RepID=UPI002366925B|nr:2-dehydro-3-deoxygalactonokinase [Pseudovibrio exalbescens]MDD7911411.1 2-dehydro-3-deoxygalactonokinase [Pseudovibrio exalbescens]
MADTPLKLAASNGDWIAVDWGTSSLRAWYVQSDGFIQTNAKSTQGAGTLSSDAFEGVLLGLIDPWLEGDKSPLPILICGMAGSRQGWKEAAYVELPTPFSALAERLVEVPVKDPRIRPFIVPGVCQNNEFGPDVIRGEETLLLGVLDEMETGRHIFCLPGTHSKWVHTEDQRILQSRTFLTGELFALVVKHSMLRHSLDGSEGAEPTHFAKGVHDVHSGAAQFLSALFPVRAAQLLNGTDPKAAYAYLSGVTIATELKELAASGGVSPGYLVEIIGSSSLVKCYASAMRIFGIETRVHDGDVAALKGLSIIRKESGV